MKRVLATAVLLAGLSSPAFFGGSGGCDSTSSFLLTVALSGSAGGGSILSSPVGIECGGDCEESFLQGTKVTLTPSANPGFLFGGFSGGGCSGTDPCTLTLNADTTVTAVFNESAAISLTVTGAGEGSVTTDAGGIACDKGGGTCAAVVAMGTDVTFTASPAPGFIFNRWRGAACPSGRTCTLSIGEDTALEASFIPILYKSNRALNGSNGLESILSENIWFTTVNGSDQFPVTVFKLAASFDPIFSPDGNKLAYTSNRNLLDGSADATTNATSNIWVQNADGSGGDTAVTNMTQATALSEVPQWTPDGARIVYNSRRSLTDVSNPDAAANGTSNLWISNVDGSDPVALTQLTSILTGTEAPRISPDGTRVVFSSRMNLSKNPADPSGGQNIWVINVDGTGLTALTSFTHDNMRNQSPEWSPEGFRIVWVSYSDPAGQAPGDPPTNNANLWVMDADGSDPAPLTRSTDGIIDSFNQVWHPDGSFIAFASQLNLLDPANGSASQVNLWRINPDGTGLQHLTSLLNAESEGTYFPPDGSFLFFVSNRDPLDLGNDAPDPNNSFNLFRIDLDGSDPLAITQISASQAECLTPYSSPD